jgi:hypothetical protein
MKLGGYPAFKIEGTLVEAVDLTDSYSGNHVFTSPMTS